MKKLLSILLSVLLIVSTFGVVSFAANENVAKVGNTEYATIDEAIAAWTNGTTLTLLADVTLSDVIMLSSTEHHILDLGTYTMTAASGKDAIQYVVNGRSSASYALDIKADATNPGGITATGGSVVRHTKPLTGAPEKDRPITRFYGGIFNASYVVRQGGTFGAGYTGASAPYFYFYGGEFNGTIYTNRSQNQFHGGVFNGQLQMSVDSSAYTLITGGKFKYLSNVMGSNLDEKIAQGTSNYKFTIGSSKSVYDKDVYVDDEGYYVVGDNIFSEEIEAGVAMTPGGDDYFYYSQVATEGALNYTDVYMALEKNPTATVTVYEEKLDLEGIDFTGTIVVPEGQTLTITNAPADLKVEGEGTVVFVEPVAKIGDTQYSTLAEAFADAQDGDTITLLADIETADAITNTKSITLDLNGKTITGTDNSTASFGLITNKGTLTVTGDGTITLVATNDRDWNAYSSVISNTVGGKLIVESGTIEHLGGSDMAYGIDNLTNGKGTYAETVVNGGTVKSTYRAIRQFLNGVEAQNILTINGGTVEGANKSVWMQDPSAKANTGILTVTEDATLIGDVYLYVTEGSTEWPVEVSIAAAALQGDSEVLTGNVPAGYAVENTNGTYGVTPVPTGSNSPAYTKEVGGYVRVWGEGGGNAKESFVLKLYSGEALMATTTLNNIGGIIDGEVYVTWNFYYPSSNDEYWTTVWEEGHPNSLAQPTEVELWIDGTCVATTPAKMSGADDINPVVWEELGGVKYIVTGLSGSGTEEDPFLINNKEELLWFQAKVDEQAADGSTQFAGVYFKLTDDIDLSGINWNPIGSMSGDHGSFKGVFDGDGHTIFNLYVEQAGTGLGLFARTAGNAVIKNLNIVNATVKSTNNSNYAGVLVGNAYASTKIENVHVSGDILVSARGYIGGIAGHGYVVMDNVSVVGNEGSLITSTFWCAGGILGYGGEGATNIKNAHVEGLTITSAAGGLGAIVGMAEDNNGTQPISGSNLSAEDVVIKTYVGGYGTAYEDYCIGYLYGGNPTSKLTGTLTVENVTVETASGNTASVNDAVASVDGDIYFDLKAAFSAAQDGNTVKLLRDTFISEYIYVNGKSLTFDGDGYKILQAPGMTLGDYLVPLRFNNGEYTIKNVVFDGWTSKSVLRIEGGSALLDNITIENTNWSTDTQTKSYGVLYIENSEVTVRNSNFLNNIAGSTITYGYGSSSDMATKLVIDNCSFEGNISNGECAIIYYVKGTGCTITNSEFIDNQVNCNTNGATVYLGFMENCVITDNLFKDNSVSDSSSSTRVAGAIFAGYQATITGNAFDNNIASNANGDVLGQVCISTYYGDGYVELSDNYWNGEAPAYGKDYTIQHQTGDGDFGMDSYYTEYELDADGNVVLSGEATNTFVAKIGTKKYTSLAEALNAAQNGDTVILLAPIVVNAGETLTLDKAITITYTSDVAGEDMITNRGTLVIDSATLIYNNTDTTASNVTVSTISCEPGSVLEVKSGVVKNDSANNGSLGIYAFAIDLLTNGSLGDVTATISGGEVISTNYMAIRQFNNGTACKNTLTVTDGYIYGAKRAIQVHLKNNAAYTTISGGTVEAGEGGYALCLFPTDAENFSVTGGTFIGTIYSGTDGFISGGTFSEEVYSGYIADGFEAIDNGDGTYGVTEEEDLYKVFYIIDMIPETNANGDTYYRVGFGAGIDSLKYSAVGFDIVAENGACLELKTTQVYDLFYIYNTDGSLNTVVEPSRLGGNYIFYQELLFPADYDNMVISFRPFYVTLSGEKVSFNKSYDISDIYTSTVKEG